MTETEILSLEKHDRIRYVGTRPLLEVFRVLSYADANLQPSIEKDYLPKNITKGLVVYSTNKHPASTTRRGDKIPEHISISFFNFGQITLHDPAEWELIERRGYVEKETEYKRARAYIPQLIERFRGELAAFLQDFQNRADYKMNSLPVDKKLKLIMELSPEDKKWFGIITSNPKEAIEAMEKAFEEEI